VNTEATARPSGRIGAVLFDLDGTLVLTHIDFAAMRSTCILLNAYIQLREKLGKSRGRLSSMT